MGWYLLCLLWLLFFLPSLIRPSPRKTAGGQATFSQPCPDPERSEGEGSAGRRKMRSGWKFCTQMRTEDTLHFFNHKRHKCVSIPSLLPRPERPPLAKSSHRKYTDARRSGGRSSGRSPPPFPFYGKGGGVRRGGMGWYETSFCASLWQFFLPFPNLPSLQHLSRHPERAEVLGEISWEKGWG